MKRTTLTTACVAALATPLLIAAPAAGDTADRASISAKPKVSDTTELREVLAEAAVTAAERRADTAYQPQDVNGARPRLPAIEQGMATLVADGAVGVTARVQTPTVTWQGSEGIRQLEQASPAAATDAFRVASISKTMVATLVMQEVQAATWTLDTLVEDVLPGTFPEHPDVTIRHLLSHTSGAPLGTDILVLLRMTDPEDLDEFFELLGEHYDDAEHVTAANLLPWEHGPGEGFTYSNPGYVVLGMMLEEVTGATVGELLQARVFEPARMTNSSYPTAPGFPERFLVDAGYIGEEPQPWRDLAHFDPTVFSHAGSVTANTGDLTRFTSALLGGQLLDPALVEQMLEPVSDEEMEYGLGIYRLPDPCAPPDSGEFLYGHDGASFGTISFALASPDGERNLALGVTGRDLTLEQDELYDLGDLLVPWLLASC